ncbi:putative leucine-rich repeat domain, L domain-containing protein [Rosa chinensis]|uniref:Putative leucine-rich repeat domain, L domain-containing protein n=1 Tax=Rosa chinensis TaxID=74649 RepID=A0A2P6QVN3_ROSCH|nr:putative leucine-rich repeat domain, L domain-containing protein [Rosa chinensis]
MFMTHIKELPSSITYFTSLRELILPETHIKELPLSIGDLTSLVELNVSKTPIRELPSSIGDLTSLDELDVSETLIEELPSSIGDLTFLKRLNLSKTPIRELPSSITNVPHGVYGGLQHLEYLNLSWCPKLVTFPSAESLPLMLPSNSLLFPQLQRLYFQGCQLSVVSDFLTNLACASTLWILNLSGSSFDSLPACISKFSRLESLDLSGCKRLRDISELPPNIRGINLDDCVSLERFSKLSNILEQKDTPGHLRSMNLSNCNRLMDNLGMDVVSKMAKALLNQLVRAGFELIPNNILV